jgi:hypothetical protein
MEVMVVFSFKDGTCDLLYRGSPMNDHQAALDGGYVLPEEHLFEMDARNLPFDLTVLKPWVSNAFHFVLPNAKGAISSRSERFGLLIEKVNENGVVIRLSMSATGLDWDDPVSPSLIFDELFNLYTENYNMEPYYYDLDPESNCYYLDFNIEVSSFNLKEVYDHVNKLVSEVENKVYKKLVRQAIDNYRSGRRTNTTQ